jgi:hypothetical protein
MNMAMSLRDDSALRYGANFKLQMIGIWINDISFDTRVGPSDAGKASWDLTTLHLGLAISIQLIMSNRYGLAYYPQVFNNMLVRW